MNLIVRQPELEGEVLGGPVMVRLYRNPFLSRYDEHTVASGSTIHEAVVAMELGSLEAYAVVWLDGERLERIDWAGRVISPEAEVIVRLIPKGGRGKSILSIVLLLLVMVAAFYLAPAFGSAIFGVEASALTTAQLSFSFGILSTIGKALVSALIPPPKVSGSTGSVGTERTFSLTGTQNRAAPFEAVPCPYGRTRMFPPYAGTPWNEIVGSTDVYLRVLFDFGFGPLKISELKIGDTPIDNFQDVQIEVGHTGDLTGAAAPHGTYYAGFDDDRDLVLYPNDVTQTNESIKVDKNSNVIRSFAPAIDEGTVTINFPRGLMVVSNAESNPGAKVPYVVAIQAHFREVGTSTWFPLIPSDLHSAVTVAEGSRNMEILDDVSGSTGWTFRSVSAIWDEADYLSRYPTVASTYNPPASELVGDPPGRAGHAWTTPVPKGLHHYAKIGTYEGKTPSWVNGATGAFVFSELAEQSIFTSYKTGKLDRTKSYEFKLNRVYGYQTSDSASTKVTVTGEEFWLSSIQGFKADKPVKNVQGHALMAMRIRATEQLNGTIQALSAKVERLLPTWNGSAWVANQITRNPAWAALDVLRGRANARPLVDARLDLATWLDFANWCAANNSKAHPRAMFDGVFDGKTTVFAALQQILAPQRASFAMKDGKYSVIWDDVQTTPVQLFTPKNSKNFSGKKIFITPPHALKVRFVNEDKGYTEDELTVYADGYNESNSSLFEQLESFGLTRPEQVFWFARYMMATAILRPETFTLEADIEALVCRRGSLVRVQHDVVRWGIGSGRVSSLVVNAGNVEQIVIEETLLLEPGKSYAIRGRRANGTIILAPINGVAVPTETKVFTLTTPTATGSMVAVGDLLALGESGKETIPCVVRNITKASDLTATLELLDYAPDIFVSDTEAIPDYDAQSTWQGSGTIQAPPIPVVDTVVSDETVMVFTPTGYVETMQIRLRADTHANQGPIRPDDTIEVRLKFLLSTALGDLGDGVVPDLISTATGSSNWFTPSEKFLGSPSVLNITRGIKAGDEIMFQVRRVTARGVASDWSTAQSHVIVGRTTLPGSVLAFTAQVRADDVLLFWTKNSEVDVVGYELRAGASWDTGTPVEPGKSPTTQTTQYVLPPLTSMTYTYWIKAKDQIDLLSSVAASVMFTIANPSKPTVSFLYQGPSVALTWADCQTSHRIAFYRVKKGAGAAVEIKTTSAIFPVDWLGSLAFEVWAVDIAGNESTHETVTVTNTGAAAPTSFTHAITGDVVQLSWDAAVPGSLPVAAYEIRYGGADWAGSTFVARVLTTTYLQAANWSGARTYRLRAVDSAGNLGTETTRAINLTVPNTIAPTYTLQAGNFTITWPLPSSLLPVKEYEIRQGASWAAGAVVATISALAYSGTVDWAGTRTFWIVARTTTGLESTPVQLDIAVTAAAAPSLATTILGPNLQLSWAPPASSLPIARYEVRTGGTDWASASHVGYSDGTLFLTPVTWSGTRTYRVAAIDSSGVTGSASSADVVIVNPNQPIPLTADVIDNNVLLRWLEPALHTLPIAFYRVRFGSTWAGGQDIGDKQGTFTSHFQTASGTYKYWVAAVDTAGNEGEPLSVDVNVSQPPDYVLKSNFNSAFAGTLTNAILESGIVYMPVNISETFQQHFDNHGSPAWTSPQDQVDDGYTIFIQPTTGSPATYRETFDYGASIPSANITLTATYETVAGSIAWSGRIEVSPDNSSWTDVANPGWTGFATSFRYVRFTVTADGTNDSAVGRLTAVNLRIDLKVKRDSGVQTCNSGDSGGTTVNFVTDFLDVDSIVVTPRGTTFAIAVVDFTDAPNPTGFKVLVFDASGTRLTRDVGWEATGV